MTPARRVSSARASHPILLAVLAAILAARATPVAADIGPAPSERCPPGYNSAGPYPAYHAFCLRWSEHGTLSVTPAVVGNGTDLHATLDLSTPACADVPFGTYPCVAAANWHTNGGTSGISYRLIKEAGTALVYLPNNAKADYYLPFDSSGVGTNGSRCNGYGTLPVTDCTFRINYSARVGVVPEMWAVWIVSLSIRTAAGYSTVWLEATSRMVGESVNAPPTAAFTWQSRDDDPLIVDFDASDSTDDTGITSYTWDFGDGTTGSGVTAHRTFGGPGTYPVRLTVTDAQGATNAVTSQIVLSPRLDVRVLLLEDTDTFEPGQEFGVAVTVSSIGARGGDLSSLEFVDTVLDTGDDGRVVVVSGPEPIPPTSFSLSPGESESFAFRLRAAARGPVTLSSRVQGKDATGDPIEASGNRQVRVGGLLDVKVVVNPSAVDLEDDDNGHKPQPVTAVVTVTNLHTASISNVALDPLDLRSRRLPAPVPASLVVLSGPSVPGPVPQPPDPSALGTIAPGASVTRFFALEARNDGHYDLQALVRAADPQGGPTIVESGRGEVKIVADVVFYYESKPAGVEDRNGVLWKPGGLHWEILGKVENRSPDKKLLVVLMPKLVGNAFYALPIIQDTQPLDTTCAIGTARTLEHDEKLTFKADVRTLTDGGTRGIVGLVPQVLVVNGDGTRSPLTEDQILVKPGSTEHIVHVDVGVPRPPELSDDERVGAYLLGSVEGLGTFAEGIWGIAQMAGKLLAFNLQPWLWDDAYRAAADKLAGYLVDVYENQTEPDKRAFKENLFAEVAIVTGQALVDVRNLVDTAVFERFEKLETAYYTGDSFEVARWYGQMTGENADMALQVLVAGYGACKLAARGVRSVALGLERKVASQAATIEQRIAAGARGLKNHDILDYARHLRDIFGIDRVSDRMFRQFAKAWKVVIVVRRRGVGVLEKLRTGKFTLKPYGLKAKNAEALDHDWLDLLRKDGTSLRDEVVIGEPPPWTEVQTKLRGQHAEVAAEVRERWMKRWEEWWGKGADEATGAGGVGGERAKWLEYEQRGSIPYSKRSVAGIQDNVEKGFSVPMDDTVQTYKGFRIERFEGPNGRQIWRCEIEDPIKGWQGVTGDIDLMALVRPDGTPIPAEARVKMYRALRHLGIEHPETLTWNNAEGLKGYLDEFGTHNPNSEALAAYMPDGETVIATRYDAGKSWINPADFRNSAQFYYHGVTTVIRAEEVTPLDMSGFEVEANAPQPLYVGPDTWTLVRPGCPGAGQIQPRLEFQGCPLTPLEVRFTNDPDALIVRQPAVGVLERWTPENGWQPLAWDQATIRVRPQTSLAEPAAAGSQTLVINDLTQLGLAPQVNAWFQVGQRVVINPGGDNEETATIVGFGSLHLAAPLRFDHLAGELVTVRDAAVGRVSIERRLSGRQLLLSYKASKPASRKLVVASKDGMQTDLGDAANVATLLAEGGNLRLVAVGGDGFDVTVPLPASGWKALRKKHPEKGIRFRGKGAVRLVVIRPGRELSVKGQGADLRFTLVEEPETVQVQVGVGDRRLCLAFPRPGKFAAEKKLVRLKAAQAPACPAE